MADQTSNLSIVLSAKDGISGVLGNLKGAFSGLSDGMKGAEGDLNKLGKTGGSTASALTLVGGVAAGALAVGIGAIGVSAIKSAANFQTMTTTLVTTAGESEKNIAKVRQGILDLSSQTGTSADQMSKAMYIIESAGYHAADGLTILKAAAQGAKTENADLGKVADAVTSSLRDYHLPASAAATVTSKLVAAVGAGKANFEEFTGALHSVLPVASAMHEPLNDILGALASMTVHGMSADQATDNLSHTLLKMQSPTSQMTNELAQLGIKSSDLSDMVGKKGLTGTLELISQTIFDKIGPSGKVMLDAFNGNKIQAADMMTMISAMPPNLQAMAKAWQTGSMSALDYKKAVKALPTDQANLMTQFTGLASKATGFSSALKSGINTSQSYSQALQAATGDSTTMKTALMLTGENADYTAQAVKKVGQAHTEAGNNVAGWALIQGNFNQQMNVAKETIKNTGTAIGTALLPAVTQFAKVLNAVLAPIALWIGKHEKLTAIIGASIFALATVTATILTLSFALGKMKSAFDVVNIFGKGTKEVSKFGGAIDDVGKSTGKISKVTEDVGKGIGGFIEGILKPLGSTAVLKGAASAALVGVAIYMIAIGVNQASKDKINIANLAILMGAMVVITGIFALLSFVGEYAIPGAIVGALVGAALWVTALGISKASDLSKNISEVNLLKLMGGLSTVSAILALILPMAAFAAIGAILDAVIAGGLVLAAMGLSKASDYAQRINKKGLDDLFDIIKRLGTLNAGGLMADLLNVAKTAALSKVATEIRNTSETLNQVRDVKPAVFDNIKKIFQNLDNIKFGSIWHDWGAEIGSGALANVAKNILTIANDLSAVKDVKPSVFTTITAIFKSLDGIKFGSIWHDWGDKIGSGALASTAKNILTISTDLAAVKDVKPSVFNTIKAIFKSLDNIKFGSLWHDWGDKEGSSALAGTAKNILSISKDLVQVKDVDPAKMKKMAQMIASAAGIEFGKGGIGGFLNLWGKSQGSGQLVDSVKNILQISKDLNAIKPVDIKKIDDIKAMIKEAGTITFKVTQANAADLGAMLNQGIALATKFVDGVKSLFGLATNAGHGLQSSVWQAVQAQMGAEYNQGRALAQQVVNGLRSMGGEATNAGHSIQSSFWNGIQSHFGDEYNQGRSLAGQVTNGIWSMQGQWWSAGDGVANGFAGGIRRNMGAINSAVGALSSAAINKLKSLLSIHSPSKVFDEIGQNVSLGMAQGIAGQSKTVASATKSIVPTVTLQGNHIVSGTATNPNANTTTAVSGSGAQSGGMGGGNITLNVNVGTYAGQPGELNNLATTIWQQIQVIARQHNLAGNLPNIGVRPV